MREETKVRAEMLRDCPHLNSVLLRVGSGNESGKRVGPEGLPQEYRPSWAIELGKQSEMHF